jgi:diadenylate cyclase
LHDGAVIIERDRIASAACKLPLSENEEVVRDLGTRHRAGIGISEVSDCVSIIVSEETGIVSLAHEGKLYRNFTKVTLKKKLQEYLIKGSQDQKRKLSSKVTLNNEK